jgi:TPR repeat protein
MTDRNHEKQRRRVAGTIRLVAVAATLATAACAQVKETASEASAKIDQWLGTESGETASAQTDAGRVVQAERLYQEGLDARARDAETDAFTSFLAAAELGHAAAAFEAGLAYRDDRGTAKDLEASAQWINRAADRGEPRAQYMIGLAYYSGTGVARDEAHAIKFLTAAATQGHAEAQLLLGRAFANGRGVAKNRAWAARWYGKAAAQGLPEAQFTYGVVRASGLGLPKNSRRGYAWLLLADRAGHAKAGEVAAALEKKLTTEQLAKATAWADKFKPAADPAFADPATVTYVQHALNGLGFEAGPVDGIRGKRSRAAISSYQESRGLPSSGKLTPELVQRLFTEQNPGA